jgi:hypothetical protein
MDRESNRNLEQLSLMIDDYQIRLAKIQKATHRVPLSDIQDKAWKASAASSTKRFIKDLKRLRRLWQPLIIDDEPTS